MERRLDCQKDAFRARKMAKIVPKSSLRSLKGQYLDTKEIVAASEEQTKLKWRLVYFTIIVREL